MEIDLMILKDALIVIGTPIVRSVSGWAVKATKDKKITKFEWKQLISTIIRVGTLGAFGYVGFKVAGVPNAAIASAVGSFLADKILSAWKKNKNVK